MSSLIITSIKFDFDMFAKRANQDQGPCHALYQIAQHLGSKIYQPDNSEVRWLDKLLSKVMGQPMHWALARRLMLSLNDDDIVYCVGEDMGIPLAILCKLANRKTRLVVTVMVPERIRTRYLIKFFGLDKVIQLFAVNAKNKLRSLQDFLGLDDKKLLLLPEKTDENFFSPGEGRMPKSSPLIASAGLEQRDYKTLAQSLDGMDVNVKICAFSPNASAKTKVSMPESVPENMEIRYFEFSELRDLYRSADIVVVSLLKNDYSAGLTVLMEAMACRRPIIMTRNSGLPEELINKGLIVGVEPGDSKGMQLAIQDLLANPAKASALASKAHDYFLVNHSSAYYVHCVSSAIQHLGTVDNNSELSKKVLASVSPGEPPLS